MLAQTIDYFKALEDKEIHHYIEKHNAILDEINQYDIDSIGSFQIAKMEYLYSQAQIYAYLIAGYYRKKQKYYEALAEQHQADSYEQTRLSKDHPLNNSTDGQYLSRRAKGKQLELAAKNEGNYIRWNGIAQAYENSINSLKDMIKALKKEESGGV